MKCLLGSGQKSVPEGVDLLGVLPQRVLRSKANIWFRVRLCQYTVKDGALFAHTSVPRDGVFWYQTREISKLGCILFFAEQVMGWFGGILIPE